MANRSLLLCLVLSISLACYFEGADGSPKRGGYSSSSSSRSSRPSSSSSGSRWSSSYSKPSYPSSGGLSGYGSSSKHSYPSSSSGLSGSGSSWSSWNSKPSYPSSGGLSGYGTGSSGSHSYPSSGGLSGYGTGSSGRHSYPSSGGLSGYGTGSGSGSHKYPSSTGLSGSGSGSSSTNLNSGSNWWSSSSSSNNNYGTHNYPSSNGGLSGTGSRPTYEVAPLPAGVLYANKHYGSHHANTPSQTNYNHGSSYGTHHHTGTSGTHVVNNHVTNVFHSTPYYTSPQYVYVNEYRNSGSRYGDILTGLALYNMGRSHSHYHDHYYHDDYYRHRYNSDGSVNSNYSPQNAAVCTMKITENGRVETLKIPCEIVSTFTNEGKQYTIPQSQVNTTTCVTNSTLVNSTSPVNATSINSTLSSNVTMMNSTTCTFTVNATDPLKVKGPPINPSNMECEVEIRTRELRTTNKVDCSTLLRYSKMPEPKSDNFILPEKQKLKQLLHNPPWWMSLFIAV